MVETWESYDSVCWSSATDRRDTMTPRTKTSNLEQRRKIMRYITRCSDDQTTMPFPRIFSYGDGYAKEVRSKTCNVRLPWSTKPRKISHFTLCVPQTEHWCHLSWSSHAYGYAKDTRSKDAKPGTVGGKKTTGASKDKQKAGAGAPNKRRKAFVTLSYIVLAYMGVGSVAKGWTADRTTTSFRTSGLV